ncbi:MAG: DUF6364 family protein [Kiritimatiellae bacterium]|nr:DUF6364 family protein [Kiritimatiellia bacterium]
MSITLSVPPVIVQQVRAYAERNGTSLNQLIRDYLESLVGGVDRQRTRAEEFAQFAKTHGASKDRLRAYRFRRADAYEEELA